MIVDANGKSHSIYGVAFDPISEKVLLTTGEIVPIADYADDELQSVDDVEDATIIVYWVDDEWRCATDIEAMSIFTVH
jgi:hypothetical protein